MEFITAPIPESRGCGGGKYSDLRMALLGLPEGESVIVPLGYLSGPAELCLHMKRDYGRPARQKKCARCPACPDPHLHVWIGPPAKGNHA
jgi:hypothetical protein